MLLSMTTDKKINTILTPPTSSAKPSPMQQFKRQKLKLDGWLNVWKPVGQSSMQTVAQARRLFSAAKAGHAGTLDPLAEGILPIALGEGTKLIPLLQDGLKTYRFMVRWGEQTATDDQEGDVIASHDHRPDAAAIQTILPDFTGVIEQVPPAFSAVKIDGQRAYKLARAGETVEIQSRPVYIDSFTLVNQPDADHAEFEVHCGTGTYVRSLARDMAQKLGTVGHCTAIIRTKVSGFTDSNAILLENLEDMVHSARLELLHPLVYGLDDILAVALRDDEAQRLLHGQSLKFLSVADANRIPVMPEGQDTALAVLGERVIAMVEVKGPVLRPVRILNT
jgi:tRNA pseudouridine55 synthase